MTFSMFSMTRLATGATEELPTTRPDAFLSGCFGMRMTGRFGVHRAVFSPQFGQAILWPASSSGNSMCCPQALQTVLAIMDVGIVITLFRQNERSIVTECALLNPTGPTGPTRLRVGLERLGGVFC